ncbi:MAG: 4-hydroxy-tetrahydrodipicolinate reductase [Oscillospiraceae bacterium]
MIRVIMHGYNGRMGRVIRESLKGQSDMEIACGIDSFSDGGEENPLFKVPQDCNIAGDVIIDFSHFSATPALLEFALKTKTPLVIATTAINEELMEKIKEASQEIAIFKSRNMSLGINLVAKALKSIAPALEDSFNMEIIEKHHNKKVDSPSGTALLLADAINESLQEKKSYIYGRHGTNDECKLSEMGIHAIRGGTIPGEHTVIFAGDDEIIEITHTALSRKIFANGAIDAARFLAGKPKGFYTMEDLLK